MTNILITGSAGFIGFNLSKDLLNKKGYKIIGIDNFNDYYDVNLKKRRNKILKKFKNYKFFKIDIKNKIKLKKFFKITKLILFSLCCTSWSQIFNRPSKKIYGNNIIGFIT